VLKKEIKYIIYYYKFNSSALLRRYHNSKQYNLIYTLFQLLENP
jgi:hypothetical protein